MTSVPEMSSAQRHANTFWDRARSDRRFQGLVGLGGDLRGAVEQLVRAMCTEDTVWHIPGNSILTGTYVGVDGVVAMLLKTAQHSEHPLTVDTLDVLATEDHVATLVREHGSRKGIALDVIEIHFHRVDEESRIVEFWDLPFDQAAVDQFWNA